MTDTAFELSQERANLNFNNFMQERKAALELDYKVSEAIWLLRATDPHMAKHLNDALGAFRDNKVNYSHESKQALPRHSLARSSRSH